MWLCLLGLGLLLKTPLSLAAALSSAQALALVSTFRSSGLLAAPSAGRYAVPPEARAAGLGAVRQIASLATAAMRISAVL